MLIFDIKFLITYKGLLSKNLLRGIIMSADMFGEFDRDLLIATHEAGHAVICHVLGYDFISITIERNETLGSDGVFRRSFLTEAKENGHLSPEGQNRWLCDKIKIILSGCS